MCELNIDGINSLETVIKKNKYLRLATGESRTKSLQTIFFNFFLLCEAETNNANRI